MDSFLNTASHFLANGLLEFSWWQVLIYTLVTTHITIASVTIFLHRAQSHRALDLHPIASHFFRFWLWLGTGMVTKEFVAIHRKHHAKCETEEDPHSPQTRGLKKLLLEGVELYRAESKNQETMQKYGHGTPDDWVEKHVYTGRSALGVSLMLILNVLLFGGIGLTVWAVQMVWIPWWATGVINGIGHYFGYRNYEASDASRNVSPWGIIVGGEELHNNHHTYPTSAKFSIKPYEVDIGWVYISLMAKVGLATVKKVPPKLVEGQVKAVADAQTLEGLIAHRYELMAGYAKAVKAAAAQEMMTLQQKGGDLAVMKAAKRWLHRDEGLVPAKAQAALQATRSAHPTLDKMLAMREELRQFWQNTTLSREQLVANLQSWCERAEASGVAGLQQLALRVRSVRA